MDSRHDYYQILHVAADASNDEIRASYRTIVQRLSSDPRVAREYASLSLINEAFRTLGDSAHRADYDRQRVAHTGMPSLLEAPRPAVARDEAPSVDAPALAAAHCPFCEGAVGAAQRDAPDAVCPRCDAPLFPAQHHTRLAESRRALDRLPMRMRASFRRSRGGRDAFKGVSQDISLGGMRLMTAVELAVGETLMVSCDFCSAVGVVRHVQASALEPGLWECGVQFVTLHVRNLRGGLLSTVA